MKVGNIGELWRLTADFEKYSKHFAFIDHLLRILYPYFLTVLFMILNIKKEKLVNIWAWSQQNILYYEPYQYTIPLGGEA